MATGERHRREVAEALRSLRAVHPDLPVALATDEPAQAPPGVHPVLRIADPRTDYSDKVRGMLASPFEHTLFLDTDTFVCGPIDDLFPLLERFDLALRREGGQDPAAPRACPASLDELNTGVLLYRRNPVVSELLANWLLRYEHERGGPAPAPNDQRAFRDALWHSSASFYVLPSDYNYLAWIPQFVQGGRAVRILHGRRRDFADASRQVNRYLVPRVLIPGPLFMHEATLGILGKRGGRLTRAWTAFARALEPLLRRKRSSRAIDPFAIPPQATPPR